jgi:hypothetical protein
MTPRKPISFRQIGMAALDHSETIVPRWLPGGRRFGREWVVRNPTRVDRTPGSFRINLQTGKWADFATGDEGGDLVSLAAYLFNLSQTEAALRIAEMLGVDPHE